MSLLIRNADYVVTMDGERTILTDGAVLVEGPRVAAVGKTAAIGAALAERVIDAQGKCVLPGFVDCHTHQMQQFARGLPDVPDPFGALFKVIYPLESALTDDDAYWSAVLCQIEMLKHGTTCFIDPGSAFPEQAARAVGDTGMRGVVSRHTWDLQRTSFGTVAQGISDETDAAIARARDTVRRLDGAHGGRVRAGYSLRVLLGCSDRLCREIKRFADEDGRSLITHAATTPSEVESSRANFGATEIVRLDRLGVLGPNLGLIHMGWTTHEELPLLRDHDVKVITDPGTSLHFGMGNMGFGRFPEMLRMGITVCLSTDASAWTFFDHVRQMHLLMGCLREARMDGTVMTPETALEIATINGAKAAGWADEIGSIEPGKKADLILFDTNRPEWRPLHNPIATLVFGASGDSVDTVVVDGRVVMENRRLLTVDEGRALAEAQRRAEAVVARAGLAGSGRTRWPIR